MHGARFYTTKNPPQTSQPKMGQSHYINMENKSNQHDGKRSCARIRDSRGYPYNSMSQGVYSLTIQGVIR